MKNLCRISNYNNKYEKCGDCLLQDLFKYHKPEYVHIYNKEYDTNIINSFAIRDNIENLRFLFVYNNKGVHDIRLDVSNVVPTNLRVFHIYMK